MYTVNVGIFTLFRRYLNSRFYDDYALCVKIMVNLCSVC